MHSRHSNTYGTYVTDVLYGSPSGRVLLYDPETMETTQLPDGIAFANVIAVHPSGDYALFAEPTTMKIWKLWLRGDKCGDRQVLQFWVTLYGPAVFISRLVSRVPDFIRRLAANLPPKLLIPSKPASMVAAIDEETGKVSVQYGDPSKTHGLVATAHRCGDDLWLGILHGSTISRFRLPDTA
ncbi:Strictosidine synthase [Gracilaria domingensis]|nr:Strictosidine synthase [Gracilaria domingensis]